MSRRVVIAGAALNPETTHVDHFVPWARYPVDLGHHFVLADSRCNGKKRERLRAYRHLATWTERNVVHGKQITDALKQSGISTELAISKQITYWAYAQTEAAAGRHG